MVFMSATMVLSGNSALRARTAFEALGLDQRRAGLDPVGAAGDGLARHLEGARQVDEVERDLDDRALPWTGSQAACRGAAPRCVGGAHTPITCTTMAALARARVEVAEHDVLVAAEREPAVDEGDGQRRPHEAGAHVRVAVAVAEVDVVLVEAVGRRHDVERLLHVLDHARLVLERREGAGGAGHEQRDGAVAEAGLAHGLGDLVGDLDHVGVAAARELDRAGDDAREAFAHVVLLLAVHEDGRHGGSSLSGGRVLGGVRAGVRGTLSMRRVDPRRTAATSRRARPDGPLELRERVGVDDGDVVERRGGGAAVEVGIAQRGIGRRRPPAPASRPGSPAAARPARSSARYRSGAAARCSGVR